MNPPAPPSLARAQRAWSKVRQELLQLRHPQGHWVGQLSSSALATATAVSTLGQYRAHAQHPILSETRLNELIEKGCHWLLSQQNLDGGWGDTDDSYSNVATTMLVIAALTLSGHAQSPAEIPALESANRYLDKKGRLQALRERYGKDKTFAVPILANCAIAGLVSWKEVAALPFEAAVVPQRFYRFINLPVVSYAIPALVGIGQVKFFKDPPWNPLVKAYRKAAVGPGLKLLARMQPASGGYLEAIPLTCFVGMSLAHSGRADHQVVQNCIRFVEDSFRDLGEQGGTWPIDTNLATWNTTLSLNALGPQHAAPKDSATTAATDHATPALLQWLLGCQFNEVHPFTGAAPGGWGWSDLSGAVPDADDTPGALLALKQWKTANPSERQLIHESAEAGIHWLLDLQNRDRGWPTFCRGWGRLPFDRSGSDITAHVLRALLAWQSEWNTPRVNKAIEGGFKYLAKNQNADGSWLPLWFGNQDHPQEDNPIYGTVKVLLAYLEANRISEPCCQQALNWILQHQNDDFGWGGGESHERHRQSPGSHQLTSSTQETALVVDLLARVLQSPTFQGEPPLHQACLQGTQWLLETIENDKTFEKWPIGFYFAKLWYYERLYPLIFTVSAIRNVCNYLETAASQETKTMT